VGGSAITGYVATAKKTSDGTTISGTGSSSPVTISGLTTGDAYTVTVAAVNSFGLGVSSAASNSVTPVESQLWSWGSNTYGQLGLGFALLAGRRSSPTQVGADTNWSGVSAGRVLNGHVLALKNTGTLWSWGYGGSGRLGHNNTTSLSTPVQIGSLTGWSQISAGGYWSMAIKTDGTLWSWGENSYYGRLGLDDTTARSSPVQVGGLTNWSKVAAGNFHTLAIKTDGTMWAWGSNTKGELGIGSAAGSGSNSRRRSPVQIGSLTTWSQISAGVQFSMAIQTGGTLWAWGNPSGGRTGLGDLVYRSSPTQVGALTNWLNVVAGDLHCVAVKTDGTLWTWGTGSQGRLGIDETDNRSSPVQVGALTGWSSKLAASYQSTFAIKTDGTFWVWGSSDQGQLGLNNTQNRSSPTQLGAATSWQQLTAGGKTTLAIKG
jgi:alpha-tubulin suppressor-like RCC1 family protein